MHLHGVLYDLVARHRLLGPFNHASERFNNGLLQAHVPTLKRGLPKLRAKRRDASVIHMAYWWSGAPRDGCARALCRLTKFGHL